MSGIKKIFHYLSFLQYPFFLLGIYYSLAPSFLEVKPLQSLNKSFLFNGLAISLATLQDIKKIPLKIDRKILANPVYSKVFVYFLVFAIVFLIAFGSYGLLYATKKSIQEISTGTIVLGIGLIGLLKTAVEIIEFHQKDQS